MTVNREVIEAWADAIESERYPRAVGYLNIGGCLCYNGVLCEVAAEAGVVERHVQDRGDLVGYGAHQDIEFLPKEVIQWSGLPSYSPTVKMVHITSHNDVLGTSPAAMAKLIREEFL